MADKEVQTTFADNIGSKFKELPTCTEDIETEWCLFRTAVITSSANCCGRKLMGENKSIEKTPWWNLEVIAIQVKTMAYEAWLAKNSSVELLLLYSEARDAAAAKAELSKESGAGLFGVIDST